MVKKFLFTIAVLFLGVSAVFAATKVPAKDVTVSTADFGMNLSGDDTTVQNALNTLDNLQPTVAWGDVTGTLSDQTDLQSALDAKVATSRKVNGYVLSSDVTITTTDLGIGNVTNHAQVYSATAPLYVTSGNVTIDTSGLGASSNIFTGNVGINSTSPRVALDIDGDLYGKSIETSTPTALKNTANYSSLTAMSANEFARSTVSAPYIIALQGLDGIKFLQGIPENLAAVVTKDSTNAIGVVNYGRYTLIADANPGLRIYDSQDVYSPTLLSTTTTHRAWGVDSLGYYAYIADDYYHPRDFGVIDFSDPNSPQWVAGLGVNYNQNIEVVGKYAYNAANSDFTVVDITDPTNPSIVGTYNTTAARDVFTVGKYAYVADGSAGFRILDISNPAAISQTGIYNTPGQAQGITCKKNLCYVADFTSGLEVFDITNQASPVLKTTYATPSAANDVQVKGTYAYIATHDNGLKIVDIGGIKTPGITAGDVDTTDINVDHNASIGNRLDVRNNVTAGHGVYSGTEVFAQTKVVAMDKLAVGTPYPSTAISFGGTTDRTIAINSNPTTNSAGSSLNVTAGSATTGMVSTVSIAVGHSDVGVYVVGDVLQLPAPAGGTSATLTVTSVNNTNPGNDVTGVSITTKGSGYTAGVTYPTFNLTRATGTVMGCTITVNTVENATDKNGGELALKSGTATGTGSSNVRIYTATAGTTGATATAATEKVAILGNGYVGIGIATPTEKLEVDGIIYSKTGGVRFPDGTLQTSAGSGSMTYPGAGIANSTGSAWATSFSTSGSGTVVALTNSPVFTNPNIGSATGSISGNAGTATALAANGTNCSAGNYPLGVDASGNAEGCNSTGIYWALGNGTSIEYSSGYVGIGTIAPTAPLEIETANTVNTGIAMQVDNSIYSSNFVILNNGNVGIGTSAPTTSLCVANGGACTFSVTSNGALTAGTSSFGVSTFTSGIQGGSSASSAMSIKSTSASGSTDHIKFLVGNNGATEAMRITTNGNIGVGTTAPFVKFEVDGGIYARGGNYYSADGSVGVSVTTCTSFKNGLCVSGT